MKTGREVGGWTEVLDDSLGAEAAVITMGQQLVEDETPVSVVEERGR